jgi:hypothetical protein
MCPEFKLKLDKMIRTGLILILLIATKYAEAQNYGCTDPLAINYDSSATHNDGSCTYDLTEVSVSASWDLPGVMEETSGLIIWNDKIWTNNDDTDINIYAFDTINIYDYDVYPLNGTVNTDWEEISQDDDYVYIGDFGNNAGGNRTDLKILRVEKSSLSDNLPVIDTIYFSYSLQTDFSSAGPNNTDFDCEALIVTSDSIYLFTKEWVSEMTSVYSLPKTPGTYTANYIETYNVEGLITGATFLDRERLVVLCGYTSSLQPFLFLLYDFQNSRFFSGNKRKLSVNLPLHQVEGVATEDGLVYYISNEKFSYSIITTSQKLHKIDLTNYLSEYLGKNPHSANTVLQGKILFYPNPVRDILYIDFPEIYQELVIFIHSTAGRLVKIVNVNDGILNLPLNVSDLPQGIYYLTIKSENIDDKFKWLKY